MNKLLVDLQISNIDINQVQRIVRSHYHDMRRQLDRASSHVRMEKGSLTEESRQYILNNFLSDETMRRIMIKEWYLITSLLQNIHLLFNDVDLAVMVVILHGERSQ